MKRFTLFLVLVLSITLLSACSSKKNSEDETSSTAASLKVSGGDVNKSYTRADLEKMAVTQATYKDVVFKGVTVSALLQDAGFTLEEIKAVKAVATDGFTVNYDTSQVLAEEVIVAYAKVDGNMSEDDGSFRMVLPGAEGKLNVRMLAEIQVVK